MCNAVRVKTSFHQADAVDCSQQETPVLVQQLEGILNMGVSEGGTDKLFGLGNVIGF